MSDLIRRQDLLDLYNVKEEYKDYSVPLPVIVQNIKDMPAVDAVEVVRHGEWLPYPSDQYRKCSVCGIEYAKYEMLLKHKYCPNCGAKMDGGEKE